MANDPLERARSMKSDLRASLNDLMWPNADAREWVLAFIDRAQHDTSTTAIVLLGSAVRSYRPYDIDILYIYHGTKVAVANKPLDVDLRFYPRNKIKEMLRDGHELFGWSLKFGILVYEKRMFWSLLQKDWQDRIPLPSVEKAKEWAQKAHSRFLSLKDMGDTDAANEQYLTCITHTARIKLLERGIYPRSRPELPAQLREINEIQEAARLQKAVELRAGNSQTFY